MDLIYIEILSDYNTSHRNDFTISYAATKSKGKASFQRSEEVGAAADMRHRITKQISKDSTDGSIGSVSSDSGSAYV